MNIASEQELIAKINRLQQVKGEHLKYEVSIEMRALPMEPSRAHAERGRDILELLLIPRGYTEGLNGQLPPRHIREDGFHSRWADTREHRGEGNHVPQPRGFANGRFPKDGVEDGQQLCQDATGCCP